MKIFHQIVKKILGLSVVVIVSFFATPSNSSALTCWTSTGSFTLLSTCPSSTYTSNPCDPWTTNCSLPAPTPTRVPTPTVKPTPAPITSPTPVQSPGYNLTPPNTTGGIADPIKNVGTAPITSGLIPCDNVTVKCDFNAFAAMINKIIDWFIGISITVATITFIIAGAKMLMNPESDSKREAAKEMFKKTVIGLFIILTAWLIVNTIVSTLVDTSSTGALRFLSN